MFRLLVEAATLQVVDALQGGCGSMVSCDVIDCRSVVGQHVGIFQRPGIADAKECLPVEEPQEVCLVEVGACPVIEVALIAADKRLDGHVVVTFAYDGDVYGVDIIRDDQFAGA